MTPNPDASAIFKLDLDPIKVKLMHVESGEGWSREHADSMEFEYRRFLYLMKKFPNEQTAPLFDVDVFWHYHILDTMKYAADCDAIFGYFLHHFPYVGLRGEKDLEAHDRVGARMGELYEQTFGEQYVPQDHAMRVNSAKTAFSAATANNKGRTAFSAAIGKTAFSAARKVAFSAATSPMEFGAADASAVSGISGKFDQALFYSIRPTLSSTA